MATKTLVTKFDHASEAESAARKLREDGFAEVGWVNHEHGLDSAHGNLVRREKGSASMRAMYGAFLGWLVGLLAFVTISTLVGLTGPLRIAIPLAAACVFAFIGGAIGRSLDSVARTEVPVPRAHRYGHDLEGDQAVVTVKVDGDEAEARALEIIRNEAGLHRHELVFRVPPISEESRPSIA
jgi:hypothetical protein